MSTTRRLGNIEEKGTKNGVLYETSYFVLHADKTDYTPTYGLAGDTSPFEFPANTYIYDWDTESHSTHWIINIRACDDDYNWGGGVERIGDIKEQGDKRGTIYTATYIVPDAQKNTYRPTYGLAGDTAPFEFNSGTFIFDWEISGYWPPSDQTDDDGFNDDPPEYWRFVIRACNDDYDHGTGARRISNIRSSHTNQGDLYEAIFLIPDAQKATYTPTYGQDGEDSPFGFPNNTYIYNWDFEPVYTNPANSSIVGGYTDVSVNAPSHWSLNVKACSDEYVWSFQNAHRIGNITEEYVREKGILYSGLYFIPTADKTTYTPTYQGDISIAPWSFPANSFACRWKFTPVYTNPVTSTKVGGNSDLTLDSPAHYILEIGGYDGDYQWDDDSSIGGVPVDEDKVKKTYGQGELLMEKEWWGVCEWQKHKYYNLWKNAGAEQKYQYTIRTYDDSKDATSDTDWVFMNAVPDAYGEEGDTDVGTVDLTVANQLFTKRTGGTVTLTQMPYTWMDKRVPITTYRLEMWRATTATLESYISWKGINSGVVGHFTPPSGCTPTGYTEEGTWRSINQTIEESNKNFGGTWYDKVTRWMESAPEGLSFKAGAHWGNHWSW